MDNRAIAALVAVDAPPASDLANFGAASEFDVGVEDARGLLLAIAPVVGAVRIVSALGNIARALGIALEAAELGEWEYVRARGLTVTATHSALFVGPRGLTTSELAA